MIKIVLIDIDGVLTDGKVTMDSSGNEYKTIDYRDIDAVFEMKRKGLKVGLITGESTPITDIFNDRFKPDFFFNGCKDKAAALDRVLDETGSTEDEVCFVGDGQYDVSIMKRVRFPACPANAIQEIKDLSNIILDLNGGDGCIRELLGWINDRNTHEP